MKVAIVGNSSVRMMSYISSRFVGQHVEIIDAGKPHLEMAQQIQETIKEHPGAILIIEGTAQPMLDEMVNSLEEDTSFKITNYKLDYPDIATIKKEKSYSKYQKGRDKRNK